MSMIDNLLCIKAKGIESFLRREAKRWACPACAGMLSAHRDRCQHCGAEKPESLRHYSASP
jgi:hypothetical protein